MSDCHSDASLTLPIPTPPDTVKPPCNRPEPCTVRLIDPVVAKFTLSTTLTLADDTENPTLRLDPRDPAVTRIRMLPPTPVDTQHTIPLSDIHILDSTTLNPARAFKELPKTPSPAPKIVKLSDPVDITFDLRTMLSMATSEVKTSVTLPIDAPKVTADRRLTPTRWSPLQLIAVSDSHLLLSQLLASRRTALLSTDTPRPEPARVKLEEPDDTTFDPLETLILGEDTEKTSVELPTVSPTLTMMRRVCLAAWPTRHRKHVSDLHSVLSHVDSPKRTVGDILPCPNRLPNTVKLRDPDEGAFASQAPPVPTSGKNKLGRSTLNEALKLPLLAPTETETVLVASTPWPVRHLTTVSEIHSLCSQTLRPTDMRRLKTKIPTFMP